MRPSLRHSPLGIVFLAIACLPACAQTVCSTTAIAAPSSKVTDIQHRLASTKIEDMETDVSPSLQQDTTLLKNNLATAVQAIVACQSTDAQPSAIQSALAQTLHANIQQPPNTLAPWGSNLRVSVDQTTAPQVLRVQVTYAIECGDDTMVFLFVPEHGHWSERLVWQSLPYKEISGAFGDFFLTAILPGKTPDDLRLVVAHGKPWCTSRFSGFGIDVLAPTSDSAHPQVLWHTDRPYSRSDFTPTLKASGDTFELRVHADEMSFDIETAFERTVIYHYRVSDTTVTRLQPIATNGRGFVEEWLSMPWLEAKGQTASTNADKVQPIHQLYESSYTKNSNSYISWTSGPVQSCFAPGRFQVTFTAQLNKLVPGQPGGEKDEPVPYYFQIKQIANGYELQSASETPDPTCTSRDLMAKPPIKPR
jgi:hypothetical protein